MLYHILPYSHLLYRTLLHSTMLPLSVHYKSFKVHTVVAADDH
jgi:hypothetical protein